MSKEKEIDKKLRIEKQIMKVQLKYQKLYEIGKNSLKNLKKEYGLELLDKVTVIKRIFII